MIVGPVQSENIMNRGGPWPNLDAIAIFTPRDLRRPSVFYVSGIARRRPLTKRRVGSGETEHELPESAL
jgi:hypothetical protein